MKTTEPKESPIYEDVIRNKYQGVVPGEEVVSLTYYQEQIEKSQHLFDTDGLARTNDALTKEEHAYYFENSYTFEGLDFNQPQVNGVELLSQKEMIDTLEAPSKGNLLQKPRKLIQRLKQQMKSSSPSLPLKEVREKEQEAKVPTWLIAWQKYGISQIKDKDPIRKTFEKLEHLNIIYQKAKAISNQVIIADAAKSIYMTGNKMFAQLEYYIVAGEFERRKTSKELFNAKELKLIHKQLLNDPRMIHYKKTRNQFEKEKESLRKQGIAIDSGLVYVQTKTTPEADLQNILWKGNKKVNDPKPRRMVSVLGIRVKDTIPKQKSNSSPFRYDEIKKHNENSQLKR